jgi:subtilisin family serine protease
MDNLNSTVEALKYAVDSNVDVINYSGGGPEPALDELRVLKEAERKGILVVAAAGNEESNIDDKAKAYYPASYGLKNIITVTAHDEELKILPSSNYGKQSVDIFAPGYRIKSSLQNGRSGYLTGTSQATAFVTGVAALIKSEFPQFSTEKIKEIIKLSAKKEITMDGKCSTGGRLDAGKALSLAMQIAGEDNKRQIAQLEAKKTGQIIYRLHKN